MGALGRASRWRWTALGLTGRIVDLSLPLKGGSVSPPSQSKRTEVSTLRRGPGHWQATTVWMSVHTASHIDSPLHCLADAVPIGEVALEKTIGEAVIVDLTHIDADAKVAAQDLGGCKGRVREGDIVLLWTGWSDRKFGDPDYFAASPYLTDEAALYLAEMKPKAVGFDFFQEYAAKTNDFTPEDFTVHRVFMTRGITIMEGLTNLGSLPRERVMFFGAPLKMMESEAAPARFFALVED